MRTNIVIDDELLAEAMRYTGIKTKKGVIDEALHALIRLRKQEQIRQLRGQLHWEGDLAALREGRIVMDAPAAYAGSDTDFDPDFEPGASGDVDR